MYTEVNEGNVILLAGEMRRRTNAFISSYSKRKLPLEELVALIDSDKVMVDAYEEDGTVLLTRNEDVHRIKEATYAQRYARYDGTLMFPTVLLNVLRRHINTDMEATLYCKAVGRRDEGKLWKHHKGGYYLLDKVTNTAASDLERFPVTVVYQNLVTEEWWSRSKEDWDRLFTKIG